jgi:hypothetical protein
MMPLFQCSTMEVCHGNEFLFIRSQYIIVQQFKSVSLSQPVNVVNVVAGFSVEGRRRYHGEQLSVPTGRRD